MKKYFLLLVLLFTISSPLFASKRHLTKTFKSDDEANDYMIEHFNRGCFLYNHDMWRLASDEFEKVVYFFPTTEAGAEAGYFLAICYYHLQEYDFANAEFSGYISSGVHLEYFEEALYYKYCIAQHLSAGKKRRPFKYRYFPKWINGQDLALTIYDEINNTVPNHELAVCSLFAKGKLQLELQEYREAIDTFQTLLRRFPKHELAPQCYLQICKAYFELSQLEYQNPDILGLSELSARKFKEEFPRDERIAEAERYAYEIKEVYAGGLCRVGKFYEKTHHPEAAAIYYQSAIEEFPETKVAAYCVTLINALDYSDEKKKKDELVPLEEEIPSPRPIELDPQKMGEERVIPGYEIPLEPLLNQGKVEIE